MQVNVHLYETQTKHNKETIGCGQTCNLVWELEEVAISIVLSAHCVPNFEWIFIAVAFIVPPELKLKNKK